MDLCVLVYQLASSFPKQELYGLTSQVQRASVSIPSNIAEGRMRGSIREYAQFISIARGSLAELRTQVTLAVRLGFVKVEDCVEIMNLAERLAQRLNALKRSLERSAHNGATFAKTETRIPKTEAID